MDSMHILRCPRCKGECLKNTDAVRCAACGIDYPVVMNIPMLIASPEEHEASLEASRTINPLWYQEEQPAEKCSPWRHHLRKRRESVQNELRAELDRRQLRHFPSLLDLGCGDGNNCAWLTHFTDSLYASDYNMVRLARAQLLVPEATFFLADILEYPAEANAFDCIFFNHVLEHIPDDTTALREVRRILKPGGLLVLGVPNEGAWWWQWAYKRDPQSLQTTDHCHFYTGPGIRQKLESVGFRLLAPVQYLGWGPPNWHWDMKLRQYKLLDDLFEIIGKAVLPTQASSLYLFATKDV